MIFTEAIKIKLKYPYERIPIMPSLYNDSFEINSNLVNLGYKEAYHLKLDWNFFAYLDSGEDMEEVRTNAIREMNQIVYGQFCLKLMECRSCIKNGSEKNAINILDYLINEITQIF